MATADRLVGKLKLNAFERKDLRFLGVQRENRYFHPTYNLQPKS